MGQTERRKGTMGTGQKAWSGEVTEHISGKRWFFKAVGGALWIMEGKELEAMC